MPKKITSRPAVGFVALGCAKATVDAERILTALRAEGYAIAPDYGQAGLVIINTCGFIEAAETESYQAIAEALARNGKVIVTGCLGAKAERLREKFPNLLAITGPAQTAHTMAEVRRHVALPPNTGPGLPPGGIKLTPRHYAYLKIAEGCNQECTFCVIPTMRGPLRSRAVDDILTEAQQLAQAGVQELLLVAQDTAAYGVDTRYRTAFWQGKPMKTRLDALLPALAEWFPWLRLHYVYPYPQVDRLVEQMAQGIVLPYLDIPLQHASPALLHAMRRPANQENLQRRIEQWRQTCPQLTLRSTFIVGFPGETEADFETLLAFLQQARLDRVGAFAYSPVAGAAANALPNPVPEPLKQERLARFMATQAAISAEKLCARLGRVEQVMVDEVHPDRLIARSPAEAPEVDGCIYIPGAWEGVVPGDFLEVRVTRADTHDVWAEPVMEDVA